MLFLKLINQCFMKNKFIQIRVSESEKEKLIEICNKLDCSYTHYCISKITGDLDFGSHKMIFDFVNKDDYFYSKVETNINQIARIINSEKQISNKLLENYNRLLCELASISNEKLQITKKIYNFLANYKSLN